MKSSKTSESDELRNHQLLEVCGLKMFQVIEHKKIMENPKSGADNRK